MQILFSLPLPLPWVTTHCLKHQIQNSPPSVPLIPPNPSSNTNEEENLFLLLPQKGFPFPEPQAPILVFLSVKTQQGLNPAVCLKAKKKNQTYNHTCKLTSWSAEQETTELSSWKQRLNSFTFGGRSQLRHGPNSLPHSSNAYPQCHWPPCHTWTSTAQARKQNVLHIHLRKLNLKGAKPLVRDHSTTE